VPVSACRSLGVGCPLGCPLVLDHRVFEAARPGRAAACPACDWSAGLPQRGLDLLPDDPG
jgi:hypothetical protein